MQEFTNLRPVVKKVLEENAETRNDDHILYFFVLQETDPNPVSSRLQMPLADALLAMQKKDLPSIHSISRIRRLLQEEAAKDPATHYLCGDRRGKEELGHETAENIMKNKK